MDNRIYMDKNKGLLPVFISALFATLIFHKQGSGLNVLVFELVTFLYLLATKQFSFKGRNMITVSVALVVTAVAFVFVNFSIYGFIVNLLVFTLFIGMVAYPQAKSLLTTLGISIVNVIDGQREFFSKLANPQAGSKGFRRRIRRLAIFFVPLLIIFVFIFIYSASNPVFDELVQKVANFIDKNILYIFQDLDFMMIFTFLLYVFVSNFIYLRTAIVSLVNKDANETDELRRVKVKQYNQYGKVIAKPSGLKNEYRAGVFLLVVLNALILLLNIIDVNWVWFNFSWEGQYLKQFVHEGTYMLIISILISIALVLYYFRNNLNFYSKNKVLKYLSYAWLAQNAVLAISVCVRNYRYVEYFSLAYKRIGVFIFLLLTLYGLYTVFIKVKDKRSSFYLFRVNAYAVLVVLVVTSLFNWDVIIAKYNFAHADRSYLHLDFMSELSDKALPYLDKPLAEVEKIKLAQQDDFEFDSGSSLSRGYSYMTPEAYCDLITYRKTQFIIDWEQKSIWEWNWLEYKAYQELKVKN